ncbi:MAG: hypothetical protein KC413_09600 [Anaerolineales bacterium]|nr:hypothetical protein [Anaerolineales bacterium]
MAILMVSQGVPMILMGDEIGRTKQGNNNTYCHDNELNWFDWNLKEQNKNLFRFVQQCIAFRKVHPILRSKTHLRHKDFMGSGYPDISWHGVTAWQPDWSEHSHTLAVMLCGQHAQGGAMPDDYIYVAMNMHWESHLFELPSLPGNRRWHVFANTSMPSPKDIMEPGEEVLLDEQVSFLVGARSVVILVGR